MFKKLRVNTVKALVELNEKLIFNQRIIKFYKKEFPHSLKTVVDVGVNTGQSIEIFKKVDKNCLIYGFEPNPKLFQMLSQKYHGNKNIVLHKTGISNKIGRKIFHENVLHSTSSFEELNMESNYLNKKATILGVAKTEIIKSSYEVEITTLCNFINNNVKTDIDILKIDTEGHEYYCLEGLFVDKLKVNLKYIQIEEHNDDMYINKKSFKEIQDLLNQNEYLLKSRIKHGFGDFHEVIFEKKLAS
jgi:FkbM family methyltransferase